MIVVKRAADVSESGEKSGGVRRRRHLWGSEIRCRKFCLAIRNQEPRAGCTSWGGCAASQVMPNNKPRVSSIINCVMIPYAELKNRSQEEHFRMELHAEEEECFGALVGGFCGRATGPPALKISATNLEPVSLIPADF